MQTRKKFSERRPLVVHEAIGPIPNNAINMEET